jgi:hypothetical protein
MFSRWIQEVDVVRFPHTDKKVDIKCSRFWNNLHHVLLKSKDWKLKLFKVLGTTHETPGA